MSDGTKPETKANANGTPADASNKSDGKPELTNAERKKLQKEEKAARRAAEKGAKGVEAPAGPQANGVASSSQRAKQQQSKSKAREVSIQEPASQRRRRESVAAPTQAPSVKAPQQPAMKSRSTKQVSFFSHLYGQPRARTLEGTSKDVHPAVSQLALQLSSYTICGSHARGVAMLLTFKSLTRSYSTPPGTSLSRHFLSHYLPPQIEALKAARPLSTTQANSIRWLKNVIATIDPSAPEDQAKNDICASIDNIISERFTVADRVIAEAMAERIVDGDVVATFGKSAVVASVLLAAAARGISFRVVVIDSRPLHEGANLARLLAAAGVDVTYTYLHGLNTALKGVTKCILGAHTVLANGKVQARAGTALVAMVAKGKRAEVLVCAETAKFSERAALDAVVVNEVAPEGELLDQHEEMPAPTPVSDATLATKKDDKAKQEAKLDASERSPLMAWRDKDNLQLLNLMYDLTPAEYVDSIITELGSLPPSAAPAVQRLSGDVE